MTVVNFNGLDLLPTYDESQSVIGPGFYFTTLTDWYTIPDSKSAIRERAQLDGAFNIDRDWRQSAAISVVGVYVGSSDTDATQAKRTLRQAIGSGATATMTVTDPLGPTSRQVSIRVVKIADDKGGHAFTFSIDSVAMDPYRYGPPVSASAGLATAGTGYPWPAVWPADWGSGGSDGRASVTNSGDAETWPILQVRGGIASGVELVEIATGSDLRLDRQIPQDSVAIFNSRTGRVYLDSAANDITGFLTRREWWSVPPGATRTVQLNPLGPTTGVPSLTVTIAPAY